MHLSVSSLPSFAERSPEVLKTPFYNSRKYQYLWKGLEIFSRIAKIVAFASLFFLSLYAHHHFPVLEEGNDFCYSLIGSLVASVLFHYLGRKAAEKGVISKNQADSHELWTKGTIAQESNNETIAKISLYIDAAISAMSSTIYNWCFGGSNKIAPSSNHGKWEDIPRFAQSLYRQDLIRTGEERGMLLTPNVDLKPFDRGVCCGACLYFAQSYYRNRNIEEVAKLFTGGAPYEAVVLHALQYKIFCSQITSNTDLNHNSAWRRALEVLANQAQLTIAEMEQDLTAETTLRSLRQKQDGIYKLHMPNGSSAHSILIIKEQGRIFIFDPNTGTKKDTSQNLDELQALFSLYGAQKCISMLTLVPNVGLVGVRASISR